MCCLCWWSDVSTGCVRAPVHGGASKLTRAAKQTATVLHPVQAGVASSVRSVQFDNWVVADNGGGAATHITATRNEVGGVEFTQSLDWRARWVQAGARLHGRERCKAHLQRQRVGRRQQWPCGAGRLRRRA